MVFVSVVIVSPPGFKYAYYILHVVDRKKLIVNI